MSELVQGLVATAAAVGALAVLWRRVVRPGVAITRRAVRAVQSALDLIEAQLRTNGGSSLMDKVDKIEANHAESRREWQRLHGRIDGIEGGLEELRVRLAASERAQGGMEGPP